MTISSEMFAGFTRAVGILSCRLLPKSPGLICFQITREPQPSAASTTSTPRVRRTIRDQRDDLTVEADADGME